MLGSTVLDVAIGLVFVYLLLGLLVSVATELVAAALSWRAANLRQGLQRLLSPALADALYDHPLISKLSKSGRGPSYIPADVFARALVDVLANLTAARPESSRDLGGMIDNAPDPDVRRVLTLLLAEAGQDGEKLKKSLEEWFNDSMDRVAGWYKRKTQVANLILAAVLAFAANADSLQIAQGLSNDAALRAALVAQAQALVKEGAPPASSSASGSPDGKAALGELDTRIARLSGLGLPVGWTDGAHDGPRRWPGWVPAGKPLADWGGDWLRAVRPHLLGWLLTALAASLGAPFWFDVLKKIIMIRSAGRVPDEPSPKAS
jgi:hypothetical protein